MKARLWEELARRIALLPPQALWVSEMLLVQLDFVMEQIRQMEQRLAELVRATPAMQWLKTMPGIGVILAANPDHGARTGPGAVEAPEESNYRTPPPLLQRILISPPGDISILMKTGTLLFWFDRSRACVLTFCPGRLRI